MTHDRPYRMGTTMSVALAEIQAERGRQFDPEVVAALLRLADRGHLTRIEGAETAGEWLGEWAGDPAVTGPPAAVGY